MGCFCRRTIYIFDCSYFGGGVSGCKEREIRCDSGSGCSTVDYRGGEHPGVGSAAVKGGALGDSARERFSFSHLGNYFMFGRDCAG